MQKKHIILIIGLFVLLIVGGAIIVNSTKDLNPDGIKFKEEYESYNGKDAYGDYKYQKLKIDKDNKVRYISLDEAVDEIETGTSLIYFGFPNCPWCRGIVPVLLDVVDCSCLESLLYVDMTDLRDTYEVNENKEAERTKEASESYYRLLELLDEYLLDYTITDEDGVEYETGEKRVYVPLVVAVKDGEVVGAHTDSATLSEGQSPFDELTVTQKGELENIYTNLISAMTEESTDEAGVCDEHC